MGIRVPEIEFLTETLHPVFQWSQKCCLSCGQSCVTTFWCSSRTCLLLVIQTVNVIILSRSRTCLLLVIQTVNVIILSHSRTCLLLVIQTVNVIILLYFSNDPLLPSTEKYVSHCFSDILTSHLGGLPTSKDVVVWTSKRGNFLQEK